MDPQNHVTNALNTKCKFLRLFQLIDLPAHARLAASHSVLQRADGETSPLAVDADESVTARCELGAPDGERGPP